MIRHMRALAVLAAACSLVAVAGCAAPTTGDDAAQDEETQDLVSRGATFVTTQESDGLYYFHLVAANGATLLDSDGYASKYGAEGGEGAVLANGIDKRKYDLAQTKSGDWYFTLKAANGAVLGTSGNYTTQVGAERGARTVRGLVRTMKKAAATSPAHT